MGLTMQPKRCAIYARISPKPEGAAGDNYSIDSQLHEMRALALKEFGCANPDAYIDKNKSGATLDRPGLDRLRDGVAAKLYDVVIAHSPDRLTRGDEMDCLLLNQELKKGGVKLAYVSGSYDDSPEGEFASEVQNAASRFERKKFRERSRRGRRQKARDGHPHSCHPPDGYKYEGHKFGKRGEYVIVPERAKIVYMIYDMTAKGWTSGRLARYLNEKGVETHASWLRRMGMKGPNSRGRWFRSSVTQVMEKTCYYGEMIQNGSTVFVREIVPRELWDRAHDALARNKVGEVGRPSIQYLLTGRIWCARCRKRCTTLPKHVTGAYRCGHFDHTDPRVRFCDAPQIRRSVIEPLVWDALWDAVCDPGLLWQLIETYHERVAGKPKQKKDPAAKRIADARAQVALSETILKDPRKLIPYEEAVSDLEAARRELAEAKIAAGAAVTEMPLRKDVVAASAMFRAMRTELESFEDRREAFLQLVEKILYADGAAEIHCHLPAAQAKNCNRREYSDCNSFDSIPFIINITVPRDSPERLTEAALKGWETRRKKKAA
jgi:site-specific DNA recombinase